MIRTKEVQNELTYDNVQVEAERFAAEYRSRNTVPELPRTEDLARYKRVMSSIYPEAIELVKERLSNVTSDVGHDFSHLEWVATLAGFIAEKECDLRNILGERKQRIIEKAIGAGLLHDIERHLGFGEEHMIEGEKTARRILEKNNQSDEDILMAVKNHDHIDFDPQANEDLEIVYGSIFDADHFRYGLEREDTFWRMKQGRIKNS